MEQTPAHDLYNDELLALMRPDYNHVVEVGVSRGSFAFGYREMNPNARYTGIEINAEYAKAASKYCTEVFVGNIEYFSDEHFTEFGKANCWVFSDVLEHLYDPWSLLKKIKQYSQPGTEIVAGIPNSQHWSLQALLCTGFFRYKDSGLLDRTHIRFFSRQTIFELFEQNGYKIIQSIPRIFEEPPEPVVAALKAMAVAVNANPERVVEEARPFQWLIRAVAV